MARGRRFGRSAIVLGCLWGRCWPVPPRRTDHPGRKRYPARECLEGILYLLYTGVRSVELPRELGFPSGETCRRRLHEWIERGVWAQALGASCLRARPAGQPRLVASRCRRVGRGRKKRGDLVGPSPLNRGFPSSKYHLPVDASRLAARGAARAGKRKRTRSPAAADRRAHHCRLPPRRGLGRPRLLQRTTPHRDPNTRNHPTDQASDNEQANRSHPNKANDKEPENANASAAQATRSPATAGSSNKPTPRSDASPDTPSPPSQTTATTSPTSPSPSPSSSNAHHESTSRHRCGAPPAAPDEGPRLRAGVSAPTSGSAARRGESRLRGSRRPAQPALRGKPLRRRSRQRRPVSHRSRCAGSPGCRARADRARRRRRLR